LIANSGAGSPTLISAETGFRRTKNKAAAATTAKKRIGFKRDMRFIVSRYRVGKSAISLKTIREIRGKGTGMIVSSTV
jgi:hypothetical protein